MEERIAVAPDLVLADMEADGFEDAIGQLGGLLVERGYAREGYVGAVLERERSYPTGLEFPACGVALPHGHARWARRAALAIGRCRRPVRFARMDDFSDTVKVSLVLLLTVDDPDAHLEVVGRLISSLSEGALCERALAAEGAEAIARIFDEAINEGGER